MVNFDNQPTVPTVLQHQKRPQWGLAFLLWEIENKNSYLFESGEVRTLSSDFSSLMVPIEAEPERVSAMLHRLEPQLQALQESRSTTPQPAAKKVSPLFTLDEQWAFFLGEYPDGFVGETWRKKVRGEGASRALKRHREPLLAEAAEKWQPVALQAMLDVRDYAGLWSCLAELLGKTDIIPASQVKLLTNPPAGSERMLAESAFNLLHGEGDLSQRFDSFFVALRKASGKKSNWQLATAMLALLKPMEHICVRSSSFSEQAKSLHVQVKRGNEVSVHAYDTYLEMALDIKAELEARGHAPHDLMDIHDFIRVTMSASARKSMASKSVKAASATEPSVLAGPHQGDTEPAAPSGARHAVLENEALADASDDASDAPDELDAA